MNGHHSETASQATSSTGSTRTSTAILKGKSTGKVESAGSQRNDSGVSSYNTTPNVTSSGSNSSTSATPSPPIRDDEIITSRSINTIRRPNRITNKLSSSTSNIHSVNGYQHCHQSSREFSTPSSRLISNSNPSTSEAYYKLKETPNSTQLLVNSKDAQIKVIIRNGKIVEGAETIPSHLRRKRSKSVSTDNLARNSNQQYLSKS